MNKRQRQNRARHLQRSPCRFCWPLFDFPGSTEHTHCVCAERNTPGWCSGCGYRAAECSCKKVSASA